MAGECSWVLLGRFSHRSLTRYGTVSVAASDGCLSARRSGQFLADPYSTSYHQHHHFALRAFDGLRKDKAAVDLRHHPCLAQNCLLDRVCRRDVDRSPLALVRRRSGGGDDNRGGCGSEMTTCCVSVSKEIRLHIGEER